MIKQETFPSLSSFPHQHQSTAPAGKEILTRTRDAVFNLQTTASYTFELSKNFVGLIADIVSQKPEDLPRAATRAMIDTGVARRHQRYVGDHPANFPGR